MLIAQKYCKLLLQRKLPKLEVELMIPSEESFDCSAYLAKYAQEHDIPIENYEIIKTRSIVGIDADKFDKHYIYFWTAIKKQGKRVDGNGNGNGNGNDDDNLVNIDKNKNTKEIIKFTCQEALNRVGYSVAQKSHYIVRIYNIL